MGSGGMPEEIQLDSLLDLYSNLNAKVEGLVKEQSGRLSIPSIPTVRKICPEEEFQLFEPAELKSLREAKLCLEEQVEVLREELKSVSERMEKLERMRRNDLEDVARLSSLASWLKRCLRSVAIDGNLLSLKPFSLMADAPVDDSKFLEVMRMIIDAKFHSSPAKENIDAIVNECRQTAVPAAAEEELSVSPRCKQVKSRNEKPPPLVLKSSELREKIQQARLIVQGRPILLSRN